MVDKKQVYIAAGTFAAAMSVGFVMQNSSASASRTMPVIEPTPAALREAPWAPLVVVAPRVGDAEAVVYPAALSVPSVAKRPTLSRPDRSTEAVSEVCDVALTGTVADKATVDLHVNAPCFASQRATLHHGGMMFTFVTDAAGAADLSVPALSTDATYIVSVGVQNGALATFAVPEADMYDRAILQWQGAQNFDMHAYENGAEYGANGHVWRDHPSDDGAMGYMMSLGDEAVSEALLAQVYTLPKGAPVDTVAFEVEATITPANCGRDITAQSLQMLGAASVSAVDLVITMPNCEAVDDVLILQNMFRDLKLASG